MKLLKFSVLLQSKNGFDNLYDLKGLVKSIKIEKYLDLLININVKFQTETYWFYCVVILFYCDYLLSKMVRKKVLLAFFFYWSENK